MTQAPWNDLISVQGVIALHAEGMRRHGHDPSSRPAENCVDGSLGAAWSAGLYREPEGARPGLCFAGHVLFYLAKNHCFTDGNKRAAWLALTAILASMGLSVHTSNDDAEAMVRGVADGSVHDADAVIFWIAERLIVFPASGETELPSFEKGDDRRGLPALPH